MKKFLAILLVVALTVTASIAGTLAYLTDRDSEANVFTVGNVAIDLEEDFDQGATLIPGVDIEKKPTITNTGANDAWVWATIAVPSLLDDDDASKNVVHFNYSEESVADGLWNWKNSDNAWNVQENVKIGEVEYNVYTVLYETALKAGETTAYPVITKVYMDPHVDIDPDGNVCHVENGEVKKLDWNINDYGTPVIYVSAYAMQTEGFATVQAAYEAYQAQWGDNGGEYAEPMDPDATYVKTLADLVKAANEGGKVKLGGDLVITEADKASFRSGNKVTAVMKDLEIDLNGHNITLEGNANPDDPITLFYVYTDTTLTIIGDGDLNATNDACLIWAHSKSKGTNIYGGNYSNDNFSTGNNGNKAMAIVYSSGGPVNIYGGTYSFETISDDCTAFNVQNSNSYANEIVLHEGVLLSHELFRQPSDDGRIALAEGCTLEETVINGTTWYKVVKQ